jgi:hypothetical protein
MRRWFWAAGIIAAMTATQAQAHYIIIRMNIGKIPGEQAPDGPRGPNGAGAGAPGMAGGPGLMAPGMAGAGGGGRPGGGGAAPGMVGPGGGPGMAGVGGAGGLRPGGGAGGLRPGGGAGSLGGPPPGMGMGAGGDPRGGGAGVGPVSPGGSAGGAFGGASNEDFDSFPYVIMAVIELKDTASHKNEKYPSLPSQWRHAYGQTALFNDGATIQSFIAPVDTPRKRLANFRKSTEQSRTKSAADYLNNAEFALSHGLLAECEELITEAGKQESKSEADKKKLAACAKVLAELNRPSDGQTTVGNWEKRLAGYGVTYSDKGHYAVFYTPKAIQVPVEVIRRGTLLENHMRAFYLWFALKGHALTFPQEKLVAIMVPDANTFKAQADALQVKTESDALFAPRDNVAIFSSHRLDELFMSLTKQTQPEWSKGWNRDELLKGKEISNAKEVKKANSMNSKDFYKEEYPRMQTLALLEKAMEDEAELAAVSHEGTDQLAVAAGLFSRNVILPEWLEFGFASVFETPKGPFAGADGSARVAFWPGYGGPSWAYLRQFKKWADSKDELSKLDAPADALKRTVTGVYFQRASKKVDLTIDDKLSGTEKEKREKEVKRAKEEVFRAKTHAWALTYYLAKWKLDDFLAFNRELVNMPHDLEMDDQTVLLTFAKAFKVAKPDGTIDEKKFADLADDWFRVIKREEVPGKDIQLKDPKRPESKSPAGGPGGGPSGPKPPGGA